MDVVCGSVHDPCVISPSNSQPSCAAIFRQNGVDMAFDVDLLGGLKDEK